MADEEIDVGAPEVDMEDGESRREGGEEEIRWRIVA